MSSSPTIGVIGLSGQSVFMDIDHFHHTGETMTAKDIHIEPGGKGHNQAVAARRLGANVKFLSILGEDSYGRQCLSQLEEEGIEPLIITSQTPTAFASILTDRNGSNQVTVYPGAVKELSVDHIWHYRYDLLQCDVIMCQLELPIEILGGVLQIAEERNIPVILNPAPINGIDNDLFSRCSMLIPNLEEAGSLFNFNPETTDFETIATAFWHTNYHYTVITMGELGALEINRNHAFFWKAEKVHTVDTTGAGDTFCAAYAVKTAEHAAEEDRIAYAIQASAYSVQHRFVIPSLPYQNQLSSKGFTPPILIAVNQVKEE